VKAVTVQHQFQEQLAQQAAHRVLVAQQRGPLGRLALRIDAGAGQQLAQRAARLGRQAAGVAQEQRAGVLVGGRCGGCRCGLAFAFTFVLDFGLRPVHRVFP
jgi:hypothetical protein